MTEPLIAPVKHTAAKRGFKVEDLIVEHVSNQDSVFKNKLLEAMNYNLTTIKKVEVIKPRGYKNSYKNLKTDISIQIETDSKFSKYDTQNISVKLVSSENLAGFNQLDKRWIDTYQKLFNMPDNITNLLKFYTGEFKPSDYINKSAVTKDDRRMFFNEFSLNDQKLILSFFKANIFKIIQTLFVGETNQFTPSWLLVIQNTDSTISSLEESKFKIISIFEAINLFIGDGEVSFSAQGNLKLGNVTMQRKGGDGGKKSANMLQFKINPNLAFN